MKLAAPRWRMPFVLTGFLLLAGLVAPAALAAPASANASITPSSPPAEAGATQDFTFSLTPTSGQISSFNLTAPSGWSFAPLVSPPAGVTRPSATQIQGRGLSITSSSPFGLSFTAQAACSPASATWSVAAKTGPNFNGSSFSIVPPPTTTLMDSCTAAFVANRGPADAAFNNPNSTKSENITSVPYTPTGAPMRVQVLDAAADPQPRPGIEIELKLLCVREPLICEPASAADASLSGSVKATSDADGIATFTGTPTPPNQSISINVVGIGYQLEPAGTEQVVEGEPSTPFGIYEEGETCGSTCMVHGRKGGIDASVTANTPSGTLSVLVSPLDVDCTDSIPADYEYQALSAQVVAWKYTGTGSQTISLLVDKTLVHQQTDRGNDIDVCFLVEGFIPGTSPPTPKSFVDKFGVTRTEASGPGLLPFCSPTITRDCILSETAVSGGDRLITFTVDDGRGKI